MTTSMMRFQQQQQQEDGLRVAKRLHTEAGGTWLRSRELNCDGDDDDDNNNNAVTDNHLLEFCVQHLLSATLSRLRDVSRGRCGGAVGGATVDSLS